MLARSLLEVTNYLLAVCLCQKIKQLVFCSLTRYTHSILETFKRIVRLCHKADLCGGAITPLTRAPSEQNEMLHADPQLEARARVPDFLWCCTQMDPFSSPS